MVLDGRRNRKGAAKRDRTDQSGIRESVKRRLSELPHGLCGGAKGTQQIHVNVATIFAVVSVGSKIVLVLSACLRGPCGRAPRYLPILLKRSVSRARRQRPSLWRCPVRDPARTH